MVTPILDSMREYYIKILSLLSALMWCTPVCHALDTMTGSQDERIRTLQLRAPADPMPLPVIVMGTDDRLIFSFDELADDRSYFRYDIKHCNANWQPSDLVDSEIIDGFNYGEIENYEYSGAVTNRYVHYSLAFPNDNMIPKVSGNYLLRVFREDNPDEVVAQWRFMVSEQTAGIDTKLSTVTDVDYNEAHQQLSVIVDTERSDVKDPFNDLILMVQQNGRHDNEVAVRHPLRMQGRYLSVYEHLNPLIFDAGNEYRRFETVRTDFPGMHVASVDYFDPYYNFTLYTDNPRASDMYLYDSTQHGARVINAYNTDMPDTDAEYVVVHFTLDMPEIPGAMVFIDGDLVDRRFDPESLMTYNKATGLYERSMLLKQGAYNYQYLVVPSGHNRGYTAPVEGDKFQTSNLYLVKVYARHPGDRYDRLIGVSPVSFN